MGGARSEDGEWDWIGLDWEKPESQFLNPHSPILPNFPRIDVRSSLKHDRHGQQPERQPRTISEAPKERDRH